MTTKTAVSKLNKLVNTKTTKKLENKIKGYDKHLQDYPDNDMCHFVKAVDLQKLGQLLNSRDYFLQALLSIDEAIKLNPSYSGYIPKRIELYNCLLKHDQQTFSTNHAQQLNKQASPKFTTVKNKHIFTLKKEVKPPKNCFILQTFEDVENGEDNISSIKMPNFELPLTGLEARLEDINLQ